ncbi:MAG TPA: 2OG-Fe(II) oxygenase family protein [Rhizomicrobium sp.]|nr:2OG-Fe(II) oxygenase family protein [Rhizomicrobium sp.]
MADRFLPVFPTTILQRRLEGMEETNRQLEALVNDIAAKEPNSTMGTTTEGGFQTKEDLFQRDNPAIATLKPHILTAVQDYAGVLIRQELTRPPAKVDFILWGWAVIYRAGHTQGLHVHPSANVSGVYYVTAPQAALEPGDPGKISFYDPRPRATMNQLQYQATRHRIAPVPGDMYLFPSWLEHSVSAFQGEGTRICIAFNAKLILE